jgi:hypothetical protein
MSQRALEGDPRWFDELRTPATTFENWQTRASGAVGVTDPE